MQRLVSFYQQHRFLIALGVLVLFLLGSRFFNFSNELGFIADNGLEFAVVSRIKSQACLPNVGPFLSIENIYIPPTYFYYRYIFGGFSVDHLQHAYISNIMKLFTIVFFAGAIWLVSNKRLFLLGFLVLSSSVFLFTSTRIVWHPNPVNLWLSLSVFLLILAKKKNRFDAMLGSLATFWFATSIYPSPFLLVPWYFVELAYLMKPYQKSWVIRFGLAGLIIMATALPFYIMQIVFESQHHWPTVTTIMAAISSVFNTASHETASVSGFITNLTVWVDNFLHSVLHIDPNVVINPWGKGFFIGSMVYLAFQALKQKGEHWLTRFPYVLTTLVAGHMVFFHFFLPGKFYAHWYAAIFMIFILSLFEAAAKLKPTIMTWFIFLTFCGTLLFNNFNTLWSIFIAEPDSSNLTLKQERMHLLSHFFDFKQLDLDRTLILNQELDDRDYTNSFLLQYNAMDNWTLTGYTTLLPPLNNECNAYVFFSPEEMSTKATNLFLLDSKANLNYLPPVLFESFIQKTIINLDENHVAVWYVNTHEIKP